MRATTYQPNLLSVQSLTAWMIMMTFCVSIGCGPGGTPTPAPVPDKPGGSTLGSTAKMEPAEVPNAPPFELETLPEGEGDVDGTFSISQVMKMAHENKLYKKLMGDDADASVAERLVLLYSSLPKQGSPKGDDDDWATRSTALYEAAKSVVAGEENAKAAFKRAVNCNSCHSRHKP